ncbi:hypothetical protein DXZ20_36540 [Leptolyngbyaceae cyanobacterium CCMR0081]|uniref:Uncharacterized protein n=2 Tax=Adonisia TaxID=2950183 RepID=A0A6M0RZB8_9CYAN|nr:hypothetical protein [Adonisia turfae CCMR0081]
MYMHHKAKWRMWHYQIIKWFPDDLFEFSGTYTKKELEDFAYDDCCRFLWAPGGLVIQNITLAICVLFNREETMSYLIWIWSFIRSFMEPMIGIFLAKIVAGFLTYLIALPLSLIGVLLIVLGTAISILLGA